MRHRKRLVATATALVMMTAAGGTAVAATSGGGTKPPATRTAEKAGSHSKGEDASKFRDLAKRYGITVGQLEHALRIVKPLVGKAKGGAANPAVIQVFAKELGLSTTQAQHLLAEIFGDGVVPLTQEDLAGLAGGRRQ